MIKLYLKYKLYELAINNAFDNIMNNFMTHNMKFKIGHSYSKIHIETYIRDIIYTYIVYDAYINYYGQSPMYRVPGSAMLEIKYTTAYIHDSNTLEWKANLQDQNTLIIHEDMIIKLYD